MQLAAVSLKASSFRTVKAKRVAGAIELVSFHQLPPDFPPRFRSSHFCLLLQDQRLRSQRWTVGLIALGGQPAPLTMLQGNVRERRRKGRGAHIPEKHSTSSSHQNLGDFAILWGRLTSTAIRRYRWKESLCLDGADQGNHSSQRRRPPGQKHHCSPPSPSLGGSTQRFT